MNLCKRSVTWLNQPALWLIIQALVVLVYFHSKDWLHVEFYPDSETYVTRWESVTDAFSRTRTVGYPLFVQSVEMISPSLAFLPVAHWGLHLGAVLMFYAGLSRLNIRPWAAMIVASSFFYTPHFKEFCNSVLTDGPGSSLAIGTVGMLLWAIGTSGHKVIWAGFTLGLFATYQVRPAYLFLVPLIPVLGLILFRLNSAREIWRQEWRPLCFRLTLACLLPYLAFASFRFALVGHFGLVSHGGWNLVGITGQFLTEEMVSELPENFRPLARDVIARRALLSPTQLEPGKQAWQSPYRPSGWLSYPVLAEWYNATIRKLYYPAIVAYYKTDFQTDPVLVNQKMGEISLAIIKARPLVYLEWIALGMWQGIKSQWFSIKNQQSYFWLLCLLGLANFVSALSRKLGIGPLAAGANQGEPETPFLLIKVMALIACLFSLSSLFLIVLVEIPIPRYMTAVEVFLPGVLVAALISWSAAIAPVRSSEHLS